MSKRFRYTLNNGASWTTVESAPANIPSSNNQTVMVEALGDTITIASQFAPYDVILAIGQSNMCGRGTYDPAIDTISEHVKQYGSYSSGANYQSILDIYPMEYPEKIETGLHSPAEDFGKRYYQLTGRNALIVPCAWGGTSLVSAAANNAPNPPQWAVNGTLYNNAISQANAAIAAAQIINQDSKFVGCIWIQGETDGDNSVGMSNYITALNSMIAGLRAGITGGANSWFIIGSMMPEAVRAYYAKYNNIHSMHQSAVLKNARTRFVQGPSNYPKDSFHYTAAGARILGTAMADEVAKVDIQEVTLDFEQDLVGSISIMGVGLEGNNGGYIVDNATRAGVSGKYLTTTSLTPTAGQFAACIFNAAYSDLVASVVEWNESTTSNAFSSGMTLRGGTAGLAGYGRTGFLFQVNGSGAANNPGTMKILKVDAAAVTELASVNIASVANRKYRASAINTALKFEYSDDNGGTWNTAVTASNSSYASGRVQYIQGFGNTTAGTVAIDSVKIRKAI